MQVNIRETEKRQQNMYAFTDRISLELYSPRGEYLTNN
jgi:hypothetical protein